MSVGDYVEVNLPTYKGKGVVVKASRNVFDILLPSAEVLRVVKGHGFDRIGIPDEDFEEALKAERGIPKAVALKLARLDKLAKTAVERASTAVAEKEDAKAKRFLSAASTAVAKGAMLLVRSGGKAVSAANKRAILASVRLMAAAKKKSTKMWMAAIQQCMAVVSRWGATEKELKKIGWTPAARAAALAARAGKGGGGAPGSSKSKSLVDSHVDSAGHDIDAAKGHMKAGRAKQARASVDQASMKVSAANKEIQRNPNIPKGPKTQARLGVQEMKAARKGRTEHYAIKTETARVGVRNAAATEGVWGK